MTKLWWRCVRRLAATRITVVGAVLVDSSGNVTRAALDRSFASQSAFHLGLATSMWVLLLVVSATPAMHKTADFGRATEPQPFWARCAQV